RVERGRFLVEKTSCLRSIRARAVELRISRRARRAYTERMKSNRENTMNSMQSLSRLFVATCFIVGSAEAASAQAVGSTLSQFNIVANPQVVLTGFSPTQPL